MGEWKSTCEYCGNHFGGYRTSRRRFCDDKCRVAWHRLQKKKDPEKVLFVLVSVIKQRIEMRQKSIESRAARLPEATGIMKQSLQELIREDEKMIEELQLLLSVKNNLELEIINLQESGE